MIFLFGLTYVMLIELPLEPARIEWFLLSYVTALTIEQIRKVIYLVYY